MKKPLKRFVGAASIMVALAGVVVRAADKRITRADYGERWPFTVEEGVLSCAALGRIGTTRVTAVYFRVGLTRYAVNGAAKGHADPDVEAIWKTRQPASPKEIVTRLSEARRRAIFSEEYACPRKAEQAASRITNVSDQIEAERTFTAKCKQTISVRENLTAKELDRIDNEGSVFGWPPLNGLPRAVSIGPIIDDGLKLCEP
jgi:Protein of unknown function (DUF2511)